MRKGCDAWRETVDKLMQQKWNAKLLAIGTAPPQALWCATEVKTFDDLKGKKLRVYTKTMVDFTTGIGAAPVNIAFREVVTALQNKVVDCAVTGTSVGNSAGWTEVTKYLTPIRRASASSFRRRCSKAGSSAPAPTSPRNGTRPWARRSGWRRHSKVANA